VLQNRGVAKAGGRDLVGAIADCDAAIRLREEIRDLQGDAWSIPLRNALARSFINRALGKNMAGDRFGSERDVASCLAIQLPLVASLGPRCPPEYHAVLDAALRLRAKQALTSTTGSRPP
jgi:hypothetical protein